MLPTTPVTTIERFILEQERHFPEATGELTNLLYDIALGTRIVAAAIRRAGLVNILGSAGATNIQGEEQQKLDVFANETLKNSMNNTGRVCVMASEEDDEIISIPPEYRAGKYAVLFDPLDGSSNIDANVSIGTIFSIHRKVSPGPRGDLTDCVQPGRKQVAAGYVVYGSSTMLVYTTGAGVHGFTLDPSIGEFLLSHPDIRIPDPPQRIYSCNEANYPRWSEGQQRFIDRLKGIGDPSAKAFSARYIGSLVADFHRTLLYGGVFMYPADRKSPNGKLRLLYEAAPLAFICEQAGGRASDGTRDILDIVPDQLHQRTPLYIGSAEFVSAAEQALRADPALAAG